MLSFKFSLVIFTARMIITFKKSINVPSIFCTDWSSFFLHNIYEENSLLVKQKCFSGIIFSAEVFFWRKIIKS